jgi:hypothetical protein
MGVGWVAELGLTLVAIDGSDKGFTASAKQPMTIVAACDPKATAPPVSSRLAACRPCERRSPKPRAHIEKVGTGFSAGNEQVRIAPGIP